MAGIVIAGQDDTWIVAVVVVVFIVLWLSMKYANGTLKMPGQSKKQDDPESSENNVILPSIEPRVDMLYNRDTKTKSVILEVERGHVDELGIEEMKFILDKRPPLFARSDQIYKPFSREDIGSGEILYEYSKKGVGDMMEKKIKELIETIKRQDLEIKSHKNNLKDKSRDMHTQILMEKEERRRRGVRSERGRQDENGHGYERHGQRENEHNSEYDDEMD